MDSAMDTIKSFLPFQADAGSVISNLSDRNFDNSMGNSFGISNNNSGGSVGNSSSQPKQKFQLGQVWFYVAIIAILGILVYMYRCHQQKKNDELRFYKEPDSNMPEKKEKKNIQTK